jgi:hypothetical protein
VLVAVDYGVEGFILAAPSMIHIYEWQKVSRKPAYKYINVCRAIASLLNESFTSQEWRSARRGEMPWPRMGHRASFYPCTQRRSSAEFFRKQHQWQGRPIQRHQSSGKRKRKAHSLLRLMMHQCTAGAAVARGTQAVVRMMR